MVAGCGNTSSDNNGAAGGDSSAKSESNSSAKSEGSSDGYTIAANIWGTGAYPLDIIVHADEKAAQYREEAAAKIVKVVETVEPDPEIAEKYETQYRKFVQIYPTVKALFPKLS